MPTALERHPRIFWRQADLPGRSYRRIVSLVPSLSEALVALGLGDRLVGVTAYCVEPPGAFVSLPKVGGTKDADAAAIAALGPDLVIANQEENTARVVRRIAEAGIDVWVTYPRTVRAGAELLRDLARLGASPEVEARVVGPVFAALEGAEAARAGWLADRRSAAGPTSVRAAHGRTVDGGAPGLVRVFCAIWRDPWMTVGRDTYIHDLIELCGGANVFAEPLAESESALGAGAGAGVGTRTEPAAGERRYPIVGREAIEQARPEVILLPSEPYAFGERDRRELLGLDCPAAACGRIHCIDGTLVSWYGPRIAEAIRVLGPLLANA
ncbi:helical backbone metal receptor [Myxococcota bacterium]|nr:helical backbone metal receptor [Myxococcota bacterium]